MSNTDPTTNVSGIDCLMRHRIPSRPFNFYLGFGLPLIGMLWLLLVDPSGIDFRIANWMYQPGVGFIGRSSWFLENILHDRAKQGVILFAVCAIAGLVASFLFPTLPRRCPLRRWRVALGYLVLAMSLSTGVVPLLKKLTQVQCPWSLTVFGGNQQYTPLIAPRSTTTKPGQCWPGGHATAGFSLFALFFFLRDHRPRSARIALTIALSLGTIFAIGRMLQGAHFLSHNLWTALIDWIICLGLYRIMLYQQSGGDRNL